jgi:hypothetical protein
MDNLMGVPPLLEGWIMKLAGPFTFLPENYFTGFEFSRLEFDYIGALA